LALSLCKLHHSAIRAFIIGVTPDYIIQVRADILEEEDGPVLQHGLKGLAQVHADFAEFEESLSQQGGVGMEI
jgi:hypothetical protein